MLAAVIQEPVTTDLPLYRDSEKNMKRDALTALSNSYVGNNVPTLEFCIKGLVAYPLVDYVGSEQFLRAGIRVLVKQPLFADVTPEMYAQALSKNATETAYANLNGFRRAALRKQAAHAALLFNGAKFVGFDSLMAVVTSEDRKVLGQA